MNGALFTNVSATVSGQCRHLRRVDDVRAQFIAAAGCDFLNASGDDSCLRCCRFNEKRKEFSLVDDFVFNHKTDEISGRFEIEFFQNPAPVGGDRTDADVQLFCTVLQADATPNEQ